MERADLARPALGTARADSLGMKLSTILSGLAVTIALASLTACTAEATDEASSTEASLANTASELSVEAAEEDTTDTSDARKQGGDGNPYVINGNNEEEKHKSGS